MRNLKIAGISAILLSILLLLSACPGTSGETSTTPNPNQVFECFGSFALGLFDVASLFGDHPGTPEVVFTVVRAGADITTSCYPVFTASSASAHTSAMMQLPNALQKHLLQPPTVSTTRLGDTCPTYPAPCQNPTPGFEALQLTWESSNTADTAMNNCNDSPLTGTYHYNIPAQMVVGTDSNQKTFIEPIVQIPGGNPQYDTLPPTSDTGSDFAAIAQHLYNADHIGQFFNTPGQYSDSVKVTIPPHERAHLTIHLLLHYRYGKALVTRGSQVNGWLWMYVYVFSHDTVHYSDTSYLEQTNAPANC